MKQVFSISFLFFCSLNVWAQNCQLIANEKFVILSGPIAHHLSQLNLLKSPQIMAVSEFHGFSSKEIVGETLGGGIFLAQKKLDQFKNHIIFYDTSDDLKKVLAYGKFKIIIEFESRGLDPFMVVEKAHEFLRPYLQSCENEEKKWQEKIQEIKKLVDHFLPPSTVQLFFLGEVALNTRLPQLLMVNDGFVKYLIEHKKIISYPSPMAYISWSSAIIDKLKKENARFIGLATQTTLPSDQCEMELVDENHYLLKSKVGLIPGWPQLCLLRAYALGVNMRQGMR
jgi:hypothetical protein